MALRRRRDELATGIEDEIPYDQSGLGGSEVPEAGPPVPGGGGMDLGGLGEAPVPEAGGIDPTMGAGPEEGGLGGELAGLEDPLAQPSPEDLEVEQLAAALEDPSIPPQEKALIEQQLALAARRQLAGIGGF